MADRRMFWSNQGVKESELNLAFELLEKADRGLSTDLGLVGIVSGLGVTQAAIPNLNVQVAAGTAYDNLGQRIHLGNVVQLSCSQDEGGLPTAVSSPGNTRILSVFIAFKRNQQVPKTDLEGDTVYWEQDESYELHVVAGAESSGTPTAPSLRSGEKLLCDITLSYGQTAIVNANISTSRKQWCFKTTSGTEIAVGTAMEAVQLLADAVGALVGIADNTAPDDGASRVGFDAITGGTYYNFTQGTLRTAMISTHTHLNAEAAARVAHVGNATGAHAATAISNTPAGSIGSTNVQTALNELDGDIQGHIGNPTGAHAATAISYAGSPNWADGSSAITSNNVEAAIDEVVTDLGATGGAARVGANPSGGLSSTSVQGQLNELDSEKARLDALAASGGSALVAGPAKAGSPFSLSAGTVKAQLEQLLDNVNAARPDTVAVTAHSYAAGWSGNLTYAKDNGGWGHVNGNAVNGTGGSAGPFITLGLLPVGVRPTKRVWARGIELNGLGLETGNYANIILDPDGSVLISGSVQSGYTMTLDFPSYKCA